MIAASVARPAVARLVNVVKEGVKAVEFARPNRVELVVVAARTADGEAEPDRAERAHTVHQVFGVELLGDASGLGIDAVIALEAGCNLLRKSRIGQQIASDLLDGELVERQVAIEGADHPIAPRPHLFSRIYLVAVRIGVAGGIEPVDGHALAVARRGEKAIDHLFIGVRRAVGQERIEFRERGRQTGQIQRHSPQQLPARGFRRRTEPFTFQTVQHETVYGVTRPTLQRHLRQRRGARSHERPMALPRCALFDPPPDERDLSRRKRLVAAVSRRHTHSGIGGADAVEQFAAIRIAGNHRRFVPAHLPGTSFRIEPQVHFSSGFVGPVAQKAAVGQDGPDVAAEVNPLRRSRRK